MFKAFKILLLLVFALQMVIPSEALAAKKKKKNRPPRTTQLTAASAIVWDVTKNHIYFSKNSNLRVYPASTTKVMTALLALENLPLDQYVTVSRRATQVMPTKLGAEAGEKFRVSELIYACLLKSANDASVVLAEAVGGSQEKFVKMMNQRAWDLGARNTRFANPHGLPSKGEQYTTARDMAVIFKAALQNPFFKSAISYKHRLIYSKDGTRYFLKSHNKSLFLDWKQDVYGKTGYTRQAQSCFVGYFKKGNSIYIVDVFGCRKRWDDLKWMIERHGGMDL